MNLTSKMVEDFKGTEFEEMAKWNQEFAIRHKVIKAEPIISSNFLKISFFFHKNLTCLDCSADYIL